MADIVDAIDALVDEQLTGYSDRSGYDYNVGQDECWHCGEDWHGLAITVRMQGMRAAYCGCGVCNGELDDYSRAEDDSAIVCPGSAFIGPVAAPSQLAAIRRGWDPVADPWSILSRATTWPNPIFTADRPYAVSVVHGGAAFEIGRAEGGIRIEFDTNPSGFDRFRARMDQLRESFTRLGVAAMDTSIAFDRLLPDPEPETPQQRALPRPSHTPPMWTNNPTRTNRRRNR